MISLLRPPGCEFVFSLKSSLVSLLSHGDLEVIARFWWLFGLVNMDFVGQRVVPICMSIWVWLAVLQVGMQHSLVVVRDEAQFLHSQ